MGLDENSGEAACYMMAPNTTLSVEDGQTVNAGDILARASREAAKAFCEAISAAECRGTWDHSQRVCKFATGAAVRIAKGPFADFAATVEGVEHSGVLRLSALIFGRVTTIRADPVEVEAA